MARSSMSNADSVDESEDEEVKLSAREFVCGLDDIHSKTEDEAYGYADMSQEGKRKCLDSLAKTIESDSTLSVRP